MSSHASPSDSTPPPAGRVGTASDGTPPPAPGRLGAWSPERLRILRIAAPALYLAALGTSIGLWGLPVSRDALFVWLALGMAAFSITSTSRISQLVLEWLPFFGLLVLYDYLRGAVAVAPAAAHVHPQIDFDRGLFGTVPTVWLQQRLFTPGEFPLYDVAAWCVYMTHFFAVWVTGAVIWRLAHERFRRYAALAVLVSLMAFATYALYPAQPPWMASQDGLIGPVTRLIPAIWGHLGIPASQSVFETGNGLVNAVAAMPSLHAAFPATLLLFFWSGSRWWWRALLGAYTLAMAFTLVYTGEHFVIDVLVGWAYAAIAFAAVALAAAHWPRRAREPAPAPGR